MVVGEGLHSQSIDRHGGVIQTLVSKFAWAKDFLNTLGCLPDSQPTCHHLASFALAPVSASQQPDAQQLVVIYAQLFILATRGG